MCKRDFLTFCQTKISKKAKKVDRWVSSLYLDIPVKDLTVLIKHSGKNASFDLLIQYSGLSDTILPVVIICFILTETSKNTLNNNNTPLCFTKNIWIKHFRSKI